MKNLIKVAFLSSIITAAMVYVILEWKPLRSEESRAPEVSLASSPVSLTTSAAPAAPANLSDDERNNIDIYQKYSPGVVNITTVTVAYDFFYRPVPQSGMGSGAVINSRLVHRLFPRNWSRPPGDCQPDRRVAVHGH